MTGQVFQLASAPISDTIAEMWPAHTSGMAKSFSIAKTKGHTSLPSVQSPSHTVIEREPSNRLQIALVLSDMGMHLEVLQELGYLDCHAENGRWPMVVWRLNGRHLAENVGWALPVVQWTQAV
jgi:hypothetical protein